MKNIEILKHFANSSTLSEYKRGLEILKQEATINGFKTTTIGLETFLANCELDDDTEKFYKMCILA